MDYGGHEKIGLVLMVIGVLGLVPAAIYVGASLLATFGAAVATVLLTAGTYLVGVSEGGRPV